MPWKYLSGPISGTHLPEDLVYPPCHSVSDTGPFNTIQMGEDDHSTWTPEQSYKLHLFQSFDCQSLDCRPSGLISCVLSGHTVGPDLHGLCAIIPPDTQPGMRLNTCTCCGTIFRSIKSVFRPSGLFCDPNTEQRTNASLPLTCPHDPGTPRPKSRVLGGARLYTFRHRLLFITVALASVLNRTIRRSFRHACRVLING